MFPEQDQKHQRMECLAKVRALYRQGQPRWAHSRWIFLWLGLWLRSHCSRIDSATLGSLAPFVEWLGHSHWLEACSSGSPSARLPRGSWCRIQHQDYPQACFHPRMGKETTRVFSYFPHLSELHASWAIYPLAWVPSLSCSRDFTAWGHHITFQSHRLVFVWRLKQLPTYLLRDHQATRSHSHKNRKFWWWASILGVDQLGSQKYFEQGMAEEVSRGLQRNFFP